MAIFIVGVVCLVVAALALCILPKSWVALCKTVLKLLLRKGTQHGGEFTGQRFPVNLDQLLGKDGPRYMTQMLGTQLSNAAKVTAVRCSDVSITDGVKGDKAIIQVEYSLEQRNLPSEFFVKFNLQKLSPVRLLVECTYVCQCEAAFYNVLADRIADIVRTPKCYFADFDRASGEFVLLSDVVRFGVGSIQPAKHRVRDKPLVEEQHLFIRTGGSLNARFWGADSCPPAVPKYDWAHEEMWVLAQLTAWLTLQRTTQKKSQVANAAFMTWEVPAGLIGKERELIKDMPHIMRSLCRRTDMMALGHNDLTTDNAFYSRVDNQSELHLGLFDWQQCCVNNVGHEYAWNWHWLPPKFLDEHEEQFIDLLLSTWAEHGRTVDRDDFLRSYCLSTVQMFVFGGGALQLLFKELHTAGLAHDLQPEDPRCQKSDELGPAVREKLVGAEMTRRTFTNCCNIMRRHDFCGKWAAWKRTKAV